MLVFLPVETQVRWETQGRICSSPPRNQRQEQHMSVRSLGALTTLTALTSLTWSLRPLPMAQEPHVCSALALQSPRELCS